MTDYTVRPTDLAAAKGGPELEAKVREEIAQLLENGLTSPLHLFFHSFEFGDDEFICYPRDGAMEVDTCYREKSDKPLDKGPLAGGHIFMPRGDSGRDPT